MIIIGINTSHNATACLLVDGKIIACISEERISRIKNQSGIPFQAIKEVLKIAKINISDVDYFVLNYLDPKIPFGYTSYEGEKEDKGLPWKKGQHFSPFALAWRVKEELLINFPNSKKFINDSLDTYYKYFVDPKVEKELLNYLENKLGVPKEKILKVDHHLSHVLPSYIMSPVAKTKPVLLFSLDSMGDGLCATVSIAKNGKIKRISSTKTGNSIGDLYTQTTAYLGMTMGEHEYKVMGIAPYANPLYYQGLLNKLKKLCWVNKDLTLETKINSHMFYKILPSLYQYERFDNISAAVQALTEEVICEWIKTSVKKTGIPDIACGGGVFMNVKANQKILELPEVKSFTVMPSSADESTAIGAAYFGFLNFSNKDAFKNIEEVTNLYLGGKFTDEDIQKEVGKTKYKRYNIKFYKNIEEEVAKLLSKGEVVARFSGRMEWGARALGNRSILSHPQKLEVVRLINEQIKSRDFWMPFAPSIIEEDEDKYFINKKNQKSPYMMITFDATEEGKDKFKAAMHQYDFTLRPQIVYKDWNPKYHELIKQFKKLTRIGGVLNTSFNLHGFPIVYTPEDALYVFQNSGLKYLALESYLISK